jgi:diaminopimelate epimerase
MKYDVQLADPAGNVTLLVTTPTEKSQYQTVAGRLLAIRELSAEQVGFLTPPVGDGVIRLEMMGGEFCGNALRCAGLYYAATQGFRRERKFPVEISGYDGSLTVWVNPLTQQVTAQMPVPLGIEEYPLFGSPLQVVRLPGILHAICPGEAKDADQVKAALAKMAEDLSSPAAGVMFWQPQAETMTPAVYVRDTDSLYFEGSCASGSTSLAAWHALRDGRDKTHKLTIRQPGGAIHTTAVLRGGKIQGITIGGKVTLGQAYTVEF